MVFGILATFPYKLIRFAAANCRRLDGTFSRLRTKTELRQLFSFSAEVLMVPVLAIGLAGGGLLATHKFLIPIPLLDQVVSLFDVSFEKWDENMETGRFGDVGRTYGEFGKEAGYSEQTSYVLRKTLKHSWLLITVLFVAFGLFVYWFVTRYYYHIVDEYRKGIFARQVEYSRVDEKRMLKS